MYIKVKHIKQFLLISACLFFAGFNYLTFVKADNTANLDSDKDGLTNEEERLYKTDPNNPDSDGDGYSDGVEIKSGYNPNIPAPGDRVNSSVTTENESTPTSDTTNNNQNLTSELIQNLKSYTDSKGSGDTVTNADIQSFINDSLAEKVGAPITWENLPEIDRSKIKSFSQAYPELSALDRKVKIGQDSAQYITRVLYLLESNLPTTIISNNDFQKFLTDFQVHMTSLSTLNPDTEYFADLGNRLELFSNQMNEVEVPETMLEIHVKFMRLIMGLLSLRESAAPIQDPVAQLALLNKVRDFSDLFVDFLENDLKNYASQFKNIQQ